MLFDLIDTHDFFGLIYPCSSGMVWANQTGGTYCAHPEMEGIFFPLDRSWLPSPDPLISWWGDYNRKMIKQFLGMNESLNRSFRSLSKKELVSHETVSLVMEEKDCRIQFGEAWIPVIVQDYPDDPLKRLANKLVILTYENSD